MLWEAALEKAKRQKKKTKKKNKKPGERKDMTLKLAQVTKSCQEELGEFPSWRG